MSPDERDDELMQEYLAGDSRLSRLYQRGTREQPSAELDARILEEARRAVAPKQRVVHSPFARHWMVPTSLAAVFVLSVSVVLLMPDPDDEPAFEIEQESVPARLSAPGEADMRREQVPGGSASAVAPRPPPAVKQHADDASGKSSEKRAAEAAERKRIGNGNLQSSPAPEGGASVADEAVAPAAMAPAQAPALTPRPMPAQSVRDDPQAWLRFIEALLDAQNRDGALSNLRAFRHRYPEIPLPASVAELGASLDAQPP